MDRVDLEPPSGSRISVTTDGGCPVIVIPHGRPDPVRYFVGLMVLCWLGWSFWQLGSWVWGDDPLFAQEWSRTGPALFVLSLAGDTLSKILGICVVYLMFRPSVPQSLKLTANGVTYDSGVPPSRYYGGDAWRRDNWKSMLPNRTRLEIDRQQLQSLRLRETDRGSRLTVDVGLVRFDLAEAVGEIERKWLHRLLANRYSLPLER